MTQITVYSKPTGCMACVNTKRKLDSLGVDYAVEDLTDPANLATAQELGYKEAPVVVVGNEHWSGYRPDRIQAVVDRINAKEAK